MHPGINKFENTIKKYVKIPNLRKLISEICLNCYFCQTEKEFSSNIYYPLNSVKTKGPNETVGIDIKGPVISDYYAGCDKHENFYVLLMVDLFSRYSEISIIFDISSDTICDEF